MTFMQKDVPLENFNSFKIGGKANYFVKVETIKNLLQMLDKWRKLSKNFSRKKRNVFVLGSGTNLLIGDKGLDGLVIQNNIDFIKIKEKRVKEPRLRQCFGRQKENQRVRVLVGAGAKISDLINFCIQNSLSGLEWAGGLPGTIGGAVRGNAGAFGGEIKDNIYEVTSLDIKTLEIKKRKNRGCGFAYRSSIFKSQSLEESKSRACANASAGKKRVKEPASPEIIVSVILTLTRGAKHEIAKKIDEKINYRKDRHPLDYPNAGSIFKNIPFENLPKKSANELSKSIKNDPFPILPTAKLLAVAGLAGKRIGNAMVSDKHPNFIVNLGNAKSDDVLKLISQIKKIIRNKYQINLEEEIQFLTSH